MQLPIEILSLIFRYNQRYIYFATQKKLLCTLLLQQALNDKYVNVKRNRNQDIFFFGITIIVLVKRVINEIVTNDQVRFYRIEIFNTCSFCCLFKLYPNKYVPIEEYKCITNKPFEKWEKIFGY